MTTADFASLIGLCLSAWAAGFTVGYLMTKYRDAMGAL